MFTQIFNSFLAQTSSYDYSYSYNSAQPSSTAASGGLLALLFGVLLVPLLITVVASIFIAISQWKIFTKANKPGWACLVPIYNFIVLLEIVGRPVWWTVLLLVPFVNMVIGIIVAIDLAKSFGKDGGYAALLILLPYVGYPMLGFGSASYVGPAASADGLPPVPAGPTNDTNAPASLGVSQSATAQPTQPTQASPYQQPASSEGQNQDSGSQSPNPPNPPSAPLVQ